MKRRYVDPFTPDLPIDSWERFSGRKEEMDSVIDSLFQLSNLNPKHTIITGDRGIGKSSVLTQIKKIAEGDSGLATKLDIDLGVEKHNFLCAWHDCTTDQTPLVLATGILSQFQNDFTSLISKFKLELNISGILKIGKKEQNLGTVGEIVELFCKELSKIAKAAQAEHKSGVILFFDELDRVNPNSGVATFFKLSAERLSRDGVKNIAFFAAGITGAIQSLEEEHGSIYRTFKDVPLPRLEEDEVEEILSTGFGTAKHTYDSSIVIETHRICAGYPEPVHLLGSQMLKSDDDSHIDDSDFNKATKEVVETLRKNKLSSTLKSAGSGKYQLILKAMAKFDGPNVPLSYISNEIGYEQNQYSTNMANLVKRDIISQVDRGVYCFVDPLLKEYISRFGIIKIDEEPDNTED
ncbi:TPA: ATP-binding protein [Vibrio harveyi]|nr:ATP-binding protein [Vibrio harveyi]